MTGSKWLFVQREERARPEDEQLSATQAYGVILQKEFERRVDRKVTQILQHLDKRRHVELDDFVISMRSFQGGLERAWNTGAIRSSYVVLRPASPVGVGYFARLFKCTDYIAALQRTSNFIRDGQDLNFNNFRLVDLPVVPLDEQRLIAKFLGHAERRIRKFIHLKQKLIKLLEEQRRVIADQAVTRGLRGGTALKRSGNRILGDVPRDWNMLRAKLLLQQVSSAIPDSAEQVTCFRDGQVTLRKNRRLTGYTEAVKELGYQGIKPGQLVLHSMDAFAGAIGISDSAGKCSPEYVICEPARNDVFLPYFGLLLRMLALRGLFVMLCPSVRERAPRVRFNDFGAFELPVPPLADQQRIVAEVDQRSAALDASLSRTRRELALVGEYRTRLISDVVTGKLDVRAAAAALPDEVEPDESEVEEADDELDEEPETADEETDE